MSRAIDTIIATLHRATLLLARSGDDATIGLAYSIDAWLSLPPGEKISFDQALGLPPTWRANARRSQRDAALRELRARHFLHHSGRKAARAVAGAVLHYETTTWPRDRRDRRRPDGVNGCCFDVLTFADHVPQEARLRQILGDEPLRLAG
jgi:hypothetical protein